jgi:hypothetical protein
MHRFVHLYEELDRTQHHQEKVAVLVSYFRATPAADAVWTLALILGRVRLPRIKSSLLRQWAAEAAKIPIWLIEECYDAVGDWSETIALLLPEPADLRQFAWSDFLHQRIQPLRKLHPEKQREFVLATWNELGRPERFLFQKMIRGWFRVPVARPHLVRALSQMSEVPPAIIDDRLWADWRPVEADFRKILGGDASRVTIGQPSLFDSCHDDGSADLPESKQEPWNREPRRIDAVLMYAQQGRGGPLYTFGVWRCEQLVPIAKAASELSEAERVQVDAFIGENTTGRFGPVRVVKPELVFEIAFDGVHASTRRKAGLILHSPRIARWRKDKSAPEADSMETLRGLLLCT